jgi:hypothetical protein
LCAWLAVAQIPFTFCALTQALTQEQESSEFDQNNPACGCGMAVRDQQGFGAVSTCVSVARGQLLVVANVLALCSIIDNLCVCYYSC